MSNAILRILLASYLAIWSPAMCCCGVKAAIGAITDTDVAACHGASAARSADVSEQSTLDGPRGCCAQRIVESETPVDECTETDPLDDSSPCRCHETLDTKVRLDTGAKVTAPALTLIATLPWFGPSAAMHDVSPFALMSVAGDVPGIGVVGRRGWYGGHLLPWRSTLLEQRTLLLI